LAPRVGTSERGARAPCWRGRTPRVANIEQGADLGRLLPARAGTAVSPADEAPDAQEPGRIGVPAVPARG
jgi:hypothetical protein